MIVKEDQDTESSPLELARKAREKFEATRAAAIKTREDDLETQREIRDLADAQALADAQDKYGIDAVALVPSLYGGVVVKRCAKVLYDNWQETGKPTALSFMKLITPCLVYPDLDAYEKLIEKQPALVGQTADAISVLAGVGFQKRIAK